MSRVAAITVLTLSLLAACSEDVPLGGSDAPPIDAADVDGPATFVLSVARIGDGTGFIVSSPVGINCGADCTETYATGTTVALSASPTGGSIFMGWSGGGCSGTGTCV